MNILTPADRASDCWRHIKKHCEERLQALRTKNDNSLTPEQTAKVRGSIAEMKHLLSLATEKPEPPPEP